MSPTPRSTTTKRCTLSAAARCCSRRDIALIQSSTGTHDDSCEKESLPRVEIGGASGHNDRLSPSDRNKVAGLQWELAKLRESSEAALLTSWAQVERLQNEYVTNLTRAQALQLELESLQNVQTTRRSEEDSTGERTNQIAHDAPAHLDGLEKDHVIEGEIGASLILSFPSRVEKTVTTVAQEKFLCNNGTNYDEAASMISASTVTTKQSEDDSVHSRETFHIRRKDEVSVASASTESSQSCVKPKGNISLMQQRLGPLGTMFPFQGKVGISEDGLQTTRMLKGDKQMIAFELESLLVAKDDEIEKLAHMTALQGEAMAELEKELEDVKKESAQDQRRDEEDMTAALNKITSLEEVVKSKNDKLKYLKMVVEKRKELISALTSEIRKIENRFD